MALDSTLFGAQIPAATYAVGDVIPMKVIRGPAVVRDGYGTAILKKAYTVGLEASTVFKVVIKNSNWIDSFSNPAINAQSETNLDDNSCSIQRGHDCVLVPNSTWDVNLVCVVAGTESAAVQAFALIDVDYPSVASIKNPRVEQGTPVSIDSSSTITVSDKTADPSTLVWNTQSVDIFKAGFKYLLSQVSCKAGSTTTIGFVEFSGAAGQGGLARIIPCKTNTYSGTRYLIDYATPLVKGPMNISIAVAGTAGSDTALLFVDFVKR